MTPDSNPVIKTAFRKPAVTPSGKLQFDATTIAPEALSKHHISFDLLQAKGQTFKSIIASGLGDAIMSCDTILGHNVAFDLAMLKAEMIRHKIDPVILSHLTSAEVVDTMTLGGSICHLRKMKRFDDGTPFWKAPRLDEMSLSILGSIPHGLHQAPNDVALTRQLALRLSTPFE
jgi:DNA polymerase III epsilon subunit-like protein